jgi:hypothetical protein
MDQDKRPSLDHVSIRFSELERLRLSSKLDPKKKVRSQIKEMIFKGMKATAFPSEDSSAKDLRGLESRLFEQTEKLVGLLAMVVARIDSLEEQLAAVGKDAARSKMVIENIQDYLADHNEPG